jgi:hypothetical protein
VTTFTVVLEVIWRGAAVGSTRDVVEAETPDEAVAEAVRAWQARRSDCSFAPLFVSAA